MMILAGVFSYMLSSFVQHDLDGVSLADSSNSVSFVSAEIQPGKQKMTQNDGHLLLLNNIMPNHQQQKIVVAQSNSTGGNTDELGDLLQRAYQAGREANKLRVRSQSRSLGPAMQAELKAQSRAKFAEQRALKEEYSRLQRDMRNQAAEQKQAQRKEAKEKERFRRASLTSEQRAAEDKSKMNAIGAMIGLMGAGNMGHGGGGTSTASSYEQQITKLTDKDWEQRIGTVKAECAAKSGKSQELCRKVAVDGFNIIWERGNDYTASGQWNALYDKFSHSHCLEKINHADACATIKQGVMGHITYASDVVADYTRKANREGYEQRRKQEEEQWLQNPAFRKQLNPHF